MELPPNITYKVFCSWPTKSGENCSNEAVGEMAFKVWNNPREDAPIMYLPVCDEHRRQALDKPR